MLHIRHISLLNNNIIIIQKIIGGFNPRKKYPGCSSPESWSKTRGSGYLKNSSYYVKN